MTQFQEVRKNPCEDGVRFVGHIGAKIDDVADKQSLFAGTGSVKSILNCAPEKVLKVVEFKKRRKRLMRQTQQALNDYAMVKPGARWLVCLSGGKDSYGLLVLLVELKWRGLLPVELIACNLDQHQPGFDQSVIKQWLMLHDVPHHMASRDTYSVVTQKIPQGQTYCSLCSRLRRGVLYDVARAFNCDAICLGHHKNDLLETFLMNMIFGGKLATMPPKLMNDEGDVEVLRPLAFVDEKDLTQLAKDLNFPILPCDLCGSQAGLKRQEIKRLIADLDSKYQDAADVMFSSLKNINPSHMLDRDLYSFE